MVGNQLFLNCKACGAEFASGMSISPESLETTTLSNQHKCPACGRTETYEKADYHYK